jgi:hypothetical protein
VENIFLYLCIIAILISLVYLFKIILNENLNNGPKKLYLKTKNGYKILFNTISYRGSKTDLEKNFNNIFLEKSDGRYIDGYNRMSNEFDLFSFSMDLFYDFLSLTERKEEKFILDLNKNVKVQGLKTFFVNTVANKISDKDFFDRTIEGEPFPYRNLLSIYQEEFNKNSIKIGFLIDNMNSYYLFTFPMEKEKIVKKAISDIGFEYTNII